MIITEPGAVATGDPPFNLQSTMWPEKTPEKG